MEHHKAPNDAPHNGSDGELVLVGSDGRGKMVVTVTSDFAVVQEELKPEEEEGRPDSEGDLEAGGGSPVGRSWRMGALFGKKG